MLRRFAGLLVCLFAGSVLFAQTDRAVLRGVVKDSSGAAVPTAHITVTEIQTNIQARALLSDANGNYEVPDLQPTTYSVKADAPGFRSFIAKDVLLDAGQVRRLDITLEVGAATESITVEAGAATIQTETGTISGELDTAKKYPATPFVDIYPSPFALMTTMPNIQGNGWNMVMAGISDRNKQTYAFDGVPNDTSGDQMDNPNFFETVQVTTVNADVDSGRAGSFNMVSKHGGNDFHGDAYYKNENSALNASTDTIPATKKIPYLFHEFEVQASGRIIKNRTFFFVGYMHQKIPLGWNQIQTMPTALERTGDFSQFATIKDPTTGAPFPNQMIPANRINATSQAVVNNYYVNPTNAALSNNYVWFFPYNQDLYKGDWPFFRIDHKLTQNNNLYFRFMRRITPYLLAGVEPALNTTSARNQGQITASDTWVVKPTLVNSLTFGYQTDLQHAGEQELGFKPLTGDVADQLLGLQGVNAGGFKSEGFPSMSVSGLSTLSMSAGGANNAISNNSGIYTLNDSATWSHGKHVVKFGANLTHLFFLVNATVSTSVYGSYTFNGSITGVAFADFMLGLPFQSSRLVNPLINRYSTQDVVAPFISDSFKVSDKLTLEFGLRWDVTTVPTFKDGLMYNFDPAANQVIVSQKGLSAISPLYPTNIKVVAGNPVPSPDMHNFRPRASFAYRLNDKTVIRGGYGEFSESFGYNSWLNNGGPYQITQTYTNTITNGVPLLTFPNAFPSSLSLAAIPNQSITAYPMKQDFGAIRQFNVTLEREWHGLGLRASYIGTRGSGLNYSLNVDKPQAGTTPFTSSAYPIQPFTGVTEYRQDGQLRYNSGQFEVSRRMGQLTFDVSWTWSNTMFNYGILENPYALGRWERDQYARRQYIPISATWLIPFGKGRQHLSGAPGVVDAIVGGWNLQTIGTLASGTYFSPSFTGTNPSNTNTSGGLPDCLANGNLPNGTRTWNRWFDPSAFAIPQPGHFGNCGGDTLVGPGIYVMHASLSKDFRIFERLKATLTGQFSNLFNHPSLGSGTPPTPNTSINQPNPGQFTSEVPYFNPERQGARQIGLKLRLVW
jgi:Carboxypeptidase regulatory-like domain/TonB dependent receptor